MIYTSLRCATMIRYLTFNLKKGLQYFLLISVYRLEMHLNTKLKVQKFYCLVSDLSLRNFKQIY